MSLPDDRTDDAASSNAAAGPLLAALDVDTLEGQGYGAGETLRILQMKPDIYGERTLTANWSSREHIMSFAELRKVSINVRARNAATVGDLAVAAGD